MKDIDKIVEKFDDLAYQFFTDDDYKHPNKIGDKVDKLLDKAQEEG